MNKPTIFTLQYYKSLCDIVYLSLNKLISVYYLLDLSQSGHHSGKYFQQLLNDLMSF